MDDHRLHSLLREWEAPAPPAALDPRVRSGFRELHPPFWRRIWLTRISVPAPLVALAMLLIAAVLWFAIRPARIPVVAPASRANQVESAGFVPLPRGDARIIEVKQ